MMIGSVLLDLDGTLVDSYPGIMASCLTALRALGHRREVSLDIRRFIGPPLELWSLLDECYEESQFPIDSPDPVDAIKFRMLQEGLRQRDLEKYFPSKSRVSKVMNHKRPLSL